MKVKIKFEVKGTNEWVAFEGEIGEKENMFGELVHFKSEGKNYVYPIGSMKVYRPKGNVACAERIDLDWLQVEYDFN